MALRKQRKPSTSAQLEAQRSEQESPHPDLPVDQQDGDHDAGGEPFFMRLKCALPGKPGEVARLLPFEFDDITIGENGNVVLVSRDGGLVIETTFGIDTFLQITEKAVRSRTGSKQRDATEIATPIGTPAPRRRMGRPRIADDIKRSPLSLYVTKALKDRLVEASKVSGRPLTQEIEVRLLRTLAEDPGRDEAEVRLDNLARQIIELVRRNWNAGPEGALPEQQQQAEPKRKSRRR